MLQTELFKPIDKGKTCRTCEHRQRWHFNSIVIQYCGVTRTNRTNNGLMKIKASRPACHKYEPENKKPLPTDQSDKG